PGQYIDLHAGGATRSFSIANLPGEARIDLIIRRYPGGRLSGLIGGENAPRSGLRFPGPYGALRLRDPARPVVMIAGGSGIGPVLALLRQLAAQDRHPKRLYFAARDPFLID